MICRNAWVHALAKIGDLAGEFITCNDDRYQLELPFISGWEDVYREVDHLLPYTEWKHLIK